MALMFERCEQASASPDFPSSENFDSDIQAFILHQEKEKKSLFVNDSDLDTLVSILYSEEKVSDINSMPQESIAMCLVINLMGSVWNFGY